MLAFWEANEKKRQILKEITNVAHQKLLHYKERMQEIIKREKEIYQNYELKKKLPRIITGLKPNSQRKTFFLKGGCHESRSRIVALSTRLSFSLNIKIHDIDHVLSNSKIINTERSSLNEDSLSSVIGKLKKRKDNEIKNLKKIPSSDRNSNNQISKSNYLEKILKKKRYKLIDEREKLLDFETMKISEIKSFQYIVSKLAPLDYEEMKKKIRIVQNLKMKIK